MTTDRKRLPENTEHYTGYFNLGSFQSLLSSSVKERPGLAGVEVGSRGGEGRPFAIYLEK